MEDKQEDIQEFKVQGDEVYSVETQASRVGWHGEKIVGNQHDGQVKIESGEIGVSDGQIVSAEFVIDMSSIAEDKGNEMVVNHLKSADFFDVATYPTAVLKISRVEGGSVVGLLTIKGIEKEVSFPATVEISGDEFRASASFEIDRTVWDVRYGSDKFFDNLGDAIIRDNISFEVEIVANK